MAKKRTKSYPESFRREAVRLAENKCNQSGFSTGSLGKCIMNIKSVWRLLLLFSSLVLITSCWSPVYKHQTKLVPIIPEREDRSTIFAQTRSRLGVVIAAIAENNGLVNCKSFLASRRNIVEYCTPNVGVHYMLTIRVTQLDDSFEIIVEEPDRTAFFKAKESDRVRKVWSEILIQLETEWPDRVKNQCEEDKKCKSIIEHPIIRNRDIHDN